MRTNPVPDILHVEAIPFVEIAFPRGTFSEGAGSKRILDIEPIYIRLGASASSVQITLDNTETHGARVSDLWSAQSPPHGSPVTVGGEIEGENRILFTGIVAGITGWDDEFVTINCESIAELYRRLIGTPMKKTGTGDGVYPNLPEENVGRIMPWIWGTVLDYIPPLVNDDQITELTQALTTTDTEAHVGSVDGFEATGGILRINEEKMDYTGVDITDPTDPQFTGLVRGQYGTGKGSHVPGNQVAEVGPLEFLVANHAMTSIDNVRYINDKGIMVPVTPDTITLTKPATITFNEAPSILVPLTSHSLKFYDANAVTAIWNCTNPTYALGAHADWTEYNYAQIDGPGHLQAQFQNAISAPPGVLVRSWFVVEFWKGSDPVPVSAVNYGGTGYGDLPDKSDTPQDVKEDHGIHSMSAGFEDDHIHTLPEGIHSHGLGAGMVTLRPRCDDGDDIDDTWNTYPEAYSGNVNSYESIRVNTIGIGAKSQIDFKLMTVPESVNLMNKIVKFQVRAKFRRTPGGADSGTLEVNAWGGNTNPGGGTNLFGAIFGPQKISAVTEETWFESVWKDTSVHATNFRGIDIPNIRFQWIVTAGTCDIDVYDMQVILFFDSDDQLAREEMYTLEPCGSDTVGNPHSYDLDFSTFADCAVNQQWRFKTSAKPNSLIKNVVFSVAGGQQTPSAWKFVLKGTTYTSLYAGGFGSMTRWENKFDVSALGATGMDLVTGGYIQGQGSASWPVIETGMWVEYENSEAGSTLNQDVGDTDEQDGNRSSLAWFDIDAHITDWTDFNDKIFQISVDAGGGELKLLRCFCAAEFIPKEYQFVKRIACDVTGRTGTEEQLITDVFTETDLNGIPAANLSIPAITGARAGVLDEQVDGLTLLDQILGECTCHGYWNWNGIFTITKRPARGSLGDPVISVVNRNCESASQVVRDINDLVNKVEVFYNYNFKDMTFGDSVEVESAGSITKYGKESPMNLELQFVRDQTVAETVGAFVLSYLDECFYEQDLRIEAIGINAEPADILAVDAHGVKGTKVEVKEVRLHGAARDKITVEIKGVKYDDT